MDFSLSVLLFPAPDLPCGPVKGFRKDLPSIRGEVDYDEAIPGKDVIFTALVDDPEIAILLDVRVRQHPIDLVNFQGRGVLGVVYAYSKPGT